MIPVYNKQYKKLKYGNLVFQIKSGRFADCFCLVNENIVIEIHNILIRSDNLLFLYGKKFCSYTSYYSYPYDSQNLNISLIKDKSENFSIWSANEIIAKCFILPTDSGFYVSFPLLYET